MHDWLSHRVDVSPDAIALVRAESGESWTYADLDARVRETAGCLAARGIEAGDHLGMVLPARPVAVFVVHAALRLGATLVPLGDRLTAAELAPRMERADLAAVVCSTETESRVAEADAAPAISVDESDRAAVATLADADPDPVEAASWERTDTQLVLFTSGTTGEPKAVALTLGNLLTNALSGALRLGHDPADRWLVALSLHHMGGIGPVLRAPLYGTTVLLREEFDAGGVVDDIDRFDATGVSLVPTMLKRMFESRGTLPGSLRVVLLGGAASPKSLVQRCRDYSVRVYPTYGMTETASQIATARPREAFDNPGTVGRPLFLTDLEVIDDDGEPLPPGEIGEFRVSGPTVASGYYGDPEATAEAFGPEGFRTGDVGYRDEDGLVYVLNRKDDRIVTGGENVDPGEVLDALHAYPDVEDAAVAGLPDEKWGERVAALVVRGDPDLEVGALESHCRDRLAGYKIPRTVAFVDELPRTVSGTVDREAVRERLADEADAAREEAGVSADPDRETDDGGEAAARDDEEGDSGFEFGPASDGGSSEREKPSAGDSE